MSYFLCFAAGLVAGLAFNLIRQAFGGETTPDAELRRWDQPGHTREGE